MNARDVRVTGASKLLTSLMPERLTLCTQCRYWQTGLAQPTAGTSEDQL